MRAKAIPHERKKNNIGGRGAAREHGLQPPYALLLDTALRGCCGQGPPQRERGNHVAQVSFGKGRSDAGRVGLEEHGHHEEHGAPDMITRNSTRVSACPTSHAIREGQ